MGQIDLSCRCYRCCYRCCYKMNLYAAFKDANNTTTLWWLSLHARSGYNFIRELVMGYTVIECNAPITLHNSKELSYGTRLRWDLKKATIHLTDAMLPASAIVVVFTDTTLIHAKFTNILLYSLRCQSCHYLSALTYPLIEWTSGIIM